MTQRQHGTHTKYAHDGCRCVPCTEANREYARRIYRVEMGYEPSSLVDVTEARNELIRLRRQGWSMRAISQGGQLSRSGLQKIWNGEAQRAYPETVEAILDFEDDVDYDLLTPGVLVPAAPTWRKVRRLLNNGWTKTALGREFGSVTPWPQRFSKRVVAATAAQVSALYRRELGGDYRATPERVVDQLVEIHFGHWVATATVAYDLEDHFAVSHDTVKRAIFRLVQAGVVESRLVDGQQWIRCVSRDPT